MIGIFTISLEYNSDDSEPTTLAVLIDLFHNIKSTDMELVKLATQNKELRIATET